MDRNFQSAPDKPTAFMSSSVTYAGTNSVQPSLHELAHQLGAELGKALSRANGLDERLRPMPMPTKDPQVPQSLNGILDVLEDCVGLTQRLHLALNGLETRIGG